MTENEVREIVKQIICEKTAIDVQIIQDDSNFRNDLNIDSLDQIDIMMDAEKKFKIRIPDEEVERLHTFQDLVEFVLDKVRVYSY
jgi:acyl carrier protein